LSELHVYILPQDKWIPFRRLAKHTVTEETVSAGFVRVLPDVTLVDLRREMEGQLGVDVPDNYVFIKCVGRNFTQVKPHQEHVVKVKSFLPPNAEEPEIHVMELSEEILRYAPSLSNLLASDTEASDSQPPSRLTQREIFNGVENLESWAEAGERSWEENDHRGLYTSAIGVLEDGEGSRERGDGMSEEKEQKSSQKSPEEKSGRERKGGGKKGEEKKSEGTAGSEKMDSEETEEGAEESSDEADRETGPSKTYTKLRSKARRNLTAGNSAAKGDGQSDSDERTTTYRRKNFKSKRRESKGEMITSQKESPEDGKDMEKETGGEPRDKNKGDNVKDGKRKVKSIGRKINGKNRPETDEDRVERQTENAEDGTAHNESSKDVTDGENGNTAAGKRNRKHTDKNEEDKNGHTSNAKTNDKESKKNEGFEILFIEESRRSNGEVGGVRMARGFVRKRNSRELVSGYEEEGEGQRDNSGDLINTKLGSSRKLTRSVSDSQVFDLGSTARSLEDEEYYLGPKLKRSASSERLGYDPWLYAPHRWYYARIARRKYSHSLKIEVT
ncbi:spermatogenesis-associated C-terminus, partial [Halocaridina rubra]